MGLLAALKQTIELWEKDMIFVWLDSKFIKRYAGKEQAEELENSMIRIITKLYFAVDTKQVPIRELLPADK